MLLGLEMQCMHARRTEDKNAGMVIPNDTHKKTAVNPKVTSEE